MERELRFGYGLQLAFDGTASMHSFTLRCMPRDTLRQRVDGTVMSVLPVVPLSVSHDSFGNMLTEGTVRIPHISFSVSVTGTVSVRESEEPVPEEVARPDDGVVFRQQSGKTVPGPAIKAFLDSAPACACGPLDTAVGLIHRLHADFEYVASSTTAKTTAEEAMAQGRGVCQDFAHIAISMLRCRGIPARYVVGLSEGEGQSHAWIEVLQDGRWYGLDPTGDRAVGGSHIKFSHGRDYDDCRINRGVFHGAAVSSQQATALVTARERFPKVFP